MSASNVDLDLSSSDVDSLDNPGASSTLVESGQRLPSCNGHGTLEILEVTRILENHKIPCCVTGVAALVYYGAGRGRDVSSLAFPMEKKTSILMLFGAGLGSLRANRLP